MCSINWTLNCVFSLLFFVLVFFSFLFWFVFRCKSGRFRHERIHHYIQTTYQMCQKFKFRNKLITFLSFFSLWQSTNRNDISRDERWFLSSLQMPVHLYSLLWPAFLLLCLKQNEIYFYFPQIAWSWFVVLFFFSSLFFSVSV